jgi:hypothetical protein
MPEVGVTEGLVGLEEIDVPILAVAGEPEVPNPFVFERKRHDGDSL